MWKNQADILNLIITVKEETKMKNTKYTYNWTAYEDKNLPNNNYSEEVETLICEKPYDFNSFLEDNGLRYEHEADTFYILNESGERTGAAYQILAEEDTDEEINF